MTEEEKTIISLKKELEKLYKENKKLKKLIKEFLKEDKQRKQDIINNAIDIQLEMECLDNEC